MKTSVKRKENEQRNKDLKNRERVKRRMSIDLEKRKDGGGKSAETEPHESTERGEQVRRKIIQQRELQVDRETQRHRDGEQRETKWWRDTDSYK